MTQPYPKTAAGRAGRAALFLTMAAADRQLLETPYFAELIREGRTVQLLARRVRASPGLAELAVRFAAWLPEAVVATARATLADGPQKVPLFPAEAEDGTGLKAA
ncbi:trans-2-enoyl-CoA reductase [Oceanithermus sp.]|uniref:trans-2-enoyl-CoA reductase n=1 Tax=Oceanithermus sp. TaxID=2268145 RepID=UPI0025EFFF7F|nr:trans-2-enoyl-CoA reductase [Oceanithermus sp.]